MTTICAKFHWNPSTKYGDIASCRICANGWTMDGQTDNPKTQCSLPTIVDRGTETKPNETKARFSGHVHYLARKLIRLILQLPRPAWGPFWGTYQYKNRQCANSSVTAASQSIHDSVEHVRSKWPVIGRRPASVQLLSVWLRHYITNFHHSHRYRGLLNTLAVFTSKTLLMTTCLFYTKQNTSVSFC